MPRFCDQKHSAHSLRCSDHFVLFSIGMKLHLHLPAVSEAHISEASPPPHTTPGQSANVVSKQRQLTSRQLVILDDCGVNAEILSLEEFRTYASRDPWSEQSRMAQAGLVVSLADARGR